MNTIFKAIVGSQAYGTSTPKSDTDYKGVYIQSANDVVSFKYKEQVDVGKDETYYEVRRFIQLLQSANPTMLELLFMPDDCVIQKSPQFDLLIQNRDKFLTKKCRHSFGGYAIAQIQKAKGLNKKMNWEKAKVERKTPFDFCYVYEDGKTIPLEKWLGREKLNKDFCGLVALDHFRDCYALYYDYKAKYQDELTRNASPYYFRGICIDDGNSLRLSSVPQEASPECVIYYNKDGYSIHCKDYKDYCEWLENRNTERYVDIKNHNQKIDGKNLLHCRRLLDMAIEIATEKTIKVRRPNAEYLLSIRHGEVDLESILSEAEKDLKRLDKIYANCDLPDEPDLEFCNKLLLKVRNHKLNEVYFENKDLPKAIIVDIDGTLAIMNGRSPFAWSKVKEDKCNSTIKKIVNSYSGTVIVFSGRDAICRQDTIDWLIVNEIHTTHLYMRQEGNNEKDSIIKRRMFEENIRGKFYIEYILDDRNQVVEMWRSLGLTCLQVADGNF